MGLTIKIFMGCFRALLNLTVMVLVAGPGWVSALSQFVSLCFGAPSARPLSWLVPLAEAAPSTKAALNSQTSKSI